MRLKINFTDFWDGFKETDNFFWNLLSRHYELELSEEPDVLLFSVFGDSFKKYKCLRIFYTGEFHKPNLNLADLSLSFSHINDSRHFRLPLFVLYHDLRILLQKPSPEKILAQKTKFCCFVVSNKSCKIRNNFFEELSKYKQVDSGGKLFNNVGGPVANKTDFIKDYKFVISFENSSAPGYTTEKIIEPMLVNSVPIYWGDPLVADDFNVKSFVNVNDFKSAKKAIEHIIEVDQNDKLYQSYLEQLWFTGNSINKNYLHENILDKLIETIDSRHSLVLAAENKADTIGTFRDRILRKLRGERKFY
ncbi:MAG: glycosyltransferase [Sphingobacteriaceae bacterium]|nr:glycosyltransferase [Sphingobacteriaceae bacterium]